jgi:hypothetical protein
MDGAVPPGNCRGPGFLPSSPLLRIRNPRSRFRRNKGHPERETDTDGGGGYILTHRSNANAHPEVLARSEAGEEGGGS